jgi:hypothetical protein
MIKYINQEQGCQNGHPMVKITIRMSISSRHLRLPSGRSRTSAITPWTVKTHPRGHDGVYAVECCIRAEVEFF